MKKALIFISTMLLTLGSCNTVTTTPAIPNNNLVEKKVSQVMKNLTLEEKIGQMTQVTLATIGEGPDGPMSSYSPFIPDTAAIRKYIYKYKIGSVLNLPNDIAQSPQAWNKIIRTLQKESIESTGIPILYGLDQMHGASYTIGATIFPQQINMGATFNRDLTYKEAEIAAYETRACSVPWIFAPVVGLGREPRWPRMWETFSEDTYLCSQLGIEAVKGFQGDNPNQIDQHHTAACLKHYVGYSVPSTGKDRTPSHISNQEMKEKFFQPFKESIEAGALSVMVNSSLNNGLPLHADYERLTKWLKKDLNWDGVIVSDWGDINNLYEREHIAATKKDAICLAINAGIDMSMVPYSYDFAILLKELVNEGRVPMSRIDDAASRIIRMKVRLGLFDHPYNTDQENKNDFKDFASEKSAKLSLDAARESMTLLKNNDNILPLKKNTKIALVGPNSNSMRTLLGGWSYNWQGNRSPEFTEQYNTIYEALIKKVGKRNITFAEGVSYDNLATYQEEKTPEYSKAMAAARGADVIVCCVGENSYAETPGNLDDLRLSRQQRELVKQLYKTEKPIILILNEGRPRIINDIEPLSQAVLQTYLPGNYGGDAIADVLYGDINPSGKLPYTYPKYTGALYTYDYKYSENIGQAMPGAYNYDAQMNVQWPFGFGLSYTKYEYSNLRVNKTNFTASDTLIFTVNVKNVGLKDGKETVLLFSSDIYATLSPDVRRLRGFEKITLKAGEEKEVNFKIPATSLAYVGLDKKWTLEKGQFIFQIASESVNLNCLETIKL